MALKIGKGTKCAIGGAITGAAITAPACLLSPQQKQLEVQSETEEKVIPQPQPLVVDGEPYSENDVKYLKEQNQRLIEKAKEGNAIEAKYNELEQQFKALSHKTAQTMQKNEGLTTANKVWKEAAMRHFESLNREKAEIEKLKKELTKYKSEDCLATPDGATYSFNVESVGCVKDFGSYMKWHIIKKLGEGYDDLLARYSGFMSDLGMPVIVFKPETSSS